MHRRNDYNGPDDILDEFHVREENIQSDIDDDGDNSEEEVDGEDLMENMEQDYRQQDELDHYEDVGIDDDQQQELSMNERMAVERRLDQRDQIQEMRGERRPGALLDDDEDMDEHEMN